MRINEVRQVITCLDDKLAVDLINNKYRLKDLLKEGPDKNFFIRLKESIDGSSHKKQNLINESVMGTLDGMLELVNTIVTNSNISNKAILTISKELNHLTLGLNDVAMHSVKTRSKLNELKDSVNKKFNLLEEEIKRIDLEAKARVELDRLFHKWKVGRYNNLTILGKVCLVLETLKWGYFGELLFKSNSIERNALIEELKDRITVQLADDLNVTPSVTLHKNIWITKCLRDEYADGMAYLCDWADPYDHPITYTVTQLNDTPSLGVPVFFNAIKISDLLTNESLIGNGK